MSYHQASSFMACSNSSLFGARPWNPGLFSINETPLPLIVWAMITVGRVRRVRALSMVASRGIKIVAVGFQHPPAEGAPFVCQWFQRHYLVGKSVILDSVSVDDGDQGWSLYGGRTTWRLPIFHLRRTRRHPVGAYTRYVFPSSRAARAHPKAKDKPMPREPEFISTPGVIG